MLHLLHLMPMHHLTQLILLLLVLLALMGLVKLHTVLQKKGILQFLPQGLFACFKLAKHNAQEIHSHKKHVDEQLLKIEARQKEIMAKNDMPYSPLRAPMDFPPPPAFYDPWEEMGGPSW